MRSSHVANTRKKQRERKKSNLSKLRKSGKANARFREIRVSERSRSSPIGSLSHELAPFVARAFLRIEWQTGGNLRDHDIFSYLTLSFFDEVRCDRNRRLSGIREREGIAHGWFTSGCGPRRESGCESYRRARQSRTPDPARCTRRATVKRETERFRGRRPTFFREDRRFLFAESGLRIRTFVERAE